jgi:hypothetical protein
MQNDKCLLQRLNSSSYPRTSFDPRVKRCLEKPLRLFFKNLSDPLISRHPPSPWLPQCVSDFLNGANELLSYEIHGESQIVHDPLFGDLHSFYVGAAQLIPLLTSGPADRPTAAVGRSAKTTHVETVIDTYLKLSLH